MATRGKRNCNAPGCSTLVAFGQGGRCPQHKAKRQVQWEQQCDQGRVSDHAFYNGKRWRRLRARFLAKHPICDYEGKRDECEHLANEVHHIKPRRDHPTLAYKASNLMALCKGCHAWVTARERKGFKPPDAVPSIPQDTDENGNVKVRYEVRNCPLQPRPEPA